MTQILQWGNRIDRRSCSYIGHLQNDPSDGRPRLSATGSLWIKLELLFVQRHAYYGLFLFDLGFFFLCFFCFFTLLVAGLKLVVQGVVR